VPNPHPRLTASPRSTASLLFLPPLPPSIASSASALLSFHLVLSHGSDIEAVAWSAAPPLPRLAVETGGSR